MSKRNMYLYGETFEVVFPRDEVQSITPGMWDYTDIYQAYERPSCHKVSIWNYWREFGLRGSDPDAPYYFGYPVITSRNCFMFTVCFNVYDVDTMEFVGIARITRDNQKLYLNK